MEKLQYAIKINTPAAKVYNTMLGLDNIKTYEQWTSLFNPTSTYEGNWEKGSKILFIGMSETGERGGMVSEIVDNIPNKFISIRHYGILSGENEITEGEEVEKWAGSLENYSFEENNNVTTLSIEVDTAEEFTEFFDSIWPQALNKLKEICEG